MIKEEFIDWIINLGFSSYKFINSGEYVIQSKELFGPKLYFTVDDFDVRLYFFNFTGDVSFGSNLGYFKLNSIGDYERQLILEKCINILSKYFDEVPQTFKKNLRDSKIENILMD